MTWLLYTMCQLVSLLFYFFVNSNKESFQVCMNSFIYLVMHMHPNTSLQGVIIIMQQINVRAYGTMQGVQLRFVTLRLWIQIKLYI